MERPVADAAGSPLTVAGAAPVLHRTSLSHRAATLARAVRVVIHWQLLHPRGETSKITPLEEWGRAVEIGEQRQAGIVILQPVGRIDNVTSQAFQTRLFAVINADAKGCIVDLSAVPYIASFGMRAIIAAARMTSPDQQFVIAAPSAVVADAFRIARLAHVLPIFDTVAEAEAALAAPP
jgi:anti-sigma B factor antagonist